ncbi:MAG TPA: lipopolysaccharide biosynthesis protein, partial [Sumerlaeia bacterium]|nr:lipopolysaccharide biosynthesis protein [Sumerlaeia bacterium]
MPSEGSKRRPSPSSPRGEKHFGADHLKSDLRKRTTRASAVIIGAQGCRFLLQLGAIAFLARWLKPEDFGLVAMVTVLTGLMLMFRDIGLSMAAIQRAEISHPQATGLFWLNVAVSIAAAAAFAALAPAVAWFFKEPRLVGVTVVLSLGFLFSGFAAQHQALLRRQMRYRRLAGVELAAIAVSLGVAVVGALLGAGYWSLVLQFVSLPLATALGVWLACDWRPGRPGRADGLLSMIASGGNVATANLVGYIGANMDTILIGRFLGTYSLGVYSRSHRLLTLPLSIVTNPLAGIIVPALSRLADAPERYRRAYVRILGKITLVFAPGAAFVIATSDWLVWLVLGPQWKDSAPILAWLAVWALLNPVSAASLWLFVSQDRTRQMLLAVSISSALSVLAFCVGLPWGPVGVAMSYSISSCLVRIPFLCWCATREGPARMGDLAGALAVPAVMAASILGLVTFGRWVFHFQNPLLGLATSAGAALGLALLILL